jgi:hypothetical protein
MAACRRGRGTFLSFGEARKKRRIPTVQVGTLVLFLFFYVAECKVRDFFLYCKHFGRKIHHFA